jgi:hypothetical protein
MGRLFHDINLTLTPATGAVTSAEFITRGELRLTCISPKTGSTTWNARIQDDAGRVLYSWTSKTGFMTDLSHVPLNGKNTLSLYTASVDEAFDILLRVEQEV